MDYSKANKALYWPSSNGANMLPVNQVTFSDQRVKQLISEDNYIRLSPKLKDIDQMIAFDASESKDIDILGKITTDFIIQNAE